MFFIGNRFKKRICLFLNSIVQLFLFCLYMSAIPIKYVYTKSSIKYEDVKEVIRNRQSKKDRQYNDQK